MSRLFARVAGFFSNRSFVGVDKAGNRYFARTEEIDGVMKEKRWVIFKGEEDPTSIPVEWICWLNGQRKRAPTPEEMQDLEARRERVRQNVAFLKKEEERRAKEGTSHKIISTGRVEVLDLKSFIRQFPIVPKGDELEEESDAVERRRTAEEKRESEEPVPELNELFFRSAEPSGSGATFRPGTWQPPT
ncbi:hypothetical protein K2173_010780 [Erythroxylum novogranatense]|uniref:NADH dehydrogenase [ubiquinone] 1 alpha subcomplex subunit 12 n=1 Tax=Erythroxylum novogranatense TaxID=1862640 RepID=A0AAV8SRU9_9ROSI|nr:hypothetical protein K2173_010780 [Erythroxylum novogranatense]